MFGVTGSYLTDVVGRVVVEGAVQSLGSKMCQDL